MIGLPGAGKTTFLAALFHVLRAENVEGALKLSRLPTHREYLVRISKTWEKFQEQAHTPAGAVNEVQLSLATRDGTPLGSVHFPDLSGEHFSDQWRLHEWSEEFDRLASSASGALLFVHPEGTTERHTVMQQEELAGVLRGSNVTVEASAAVERWDPSQASTAVKLVGLMQQILSRGNRRPFKLGVVVSAWDLVASEALDPPGWVRRRLSLLDQYLLSNRDRIHSRVFGLSAQGGPLRGDIEALTNMPTATMRIRVLGGGNVHDISWPLRWLMTNGG